MIDEMEGNGGGNAKRDGRMPSPRRRDDALGRRLVVLGRTALRRIVKHARDHIGRDVVRFEVFERGDGIARFLHRDAMVDDRSHAQVTAFVVGPGNRKITPGLHSV